MMKLTKYTQKLTVASMLLALGIILPFATSHGFGVPGNILLPMHIPVFLCGLLCGPLYGTLTGLLLPVLNCVLTGMPVPYPMLPLMLCELTAYGLISGLLFHKTLLGRYKLGVYASLIVAMICGRAAYGGALSLLLLVDTEVKASGVWAAFITGIPGIVVQLLLIPAIIFAMEGILKMPKHNAMISAKNLIAHGKATCVVIKNGSVVNVESGRGVKPIISMYEQGLLQDAVVVDKIIGKAAAMILVLGGVKACYGLTMSQGAVTYLKARGVSAEYDTLTEHIINRKGDGICPMEQTVAELDDPVQALEALKAKITELSTHSNEIQNHLSR
jgi:niacin transporter